jgi:hypothetical protein
LLLKQPGFTLTAVVTLALVIGASVTTAIKVKKERFADIRAQ